MQRVARSIRDNNALAEHGKPHLGDREFILAITVVVVEHGRPACCSQGYVRRNVSKDYQEKNTLSC